MMKSMRNAQPVNSLRRLGPLAMALLTIGCGVVEVGGGDAGDTAVDQGESMDAFLLDAADVGDDVDWDAPPPADATVPGDAGPLVDAAVVPDAATPDAAAPVPDAAMPDLRPEAEVTYMTANIGRNYSERSEVASILDRLGDFIGPRPGPALIGWQEIGEGDPCGNCEWELIRGRFSTGWDNRRPTARGQMVKVPVSAQGVSDVSASAAFASPGWAGVSPTRFVTVVHYGDRNLSMVNTHFIAGAWSCGSNQEMRREYWRQAWDALKSEVAAEHARGRNVVVTGDLNRGRGTSRCNPAWNPESLHPDARIIGGAGIDYIYAVPASGWRFVFGRNGAGEIQRGARSIGIDGHSAHWVTGSFRH